MCKTNSAHKQSRCRAEEQCPLTVIKQTNKKKEISMAGAAAWTGRYFLQKRKGVGFVSTLRGALWIKTRAGNHNLHVLGHSGGPNEAQFYIISSVQRKQNI